MKAYLDIVENVLINGRWKNNRTKTRALTCANQFFSHDMSNGFPLLTTKRMPMKTIAVELEGFIKGITSKKWYQERGCRIWDKWANPKAIEKKHNEYSKSAAEEDDLGPIYGYQWRRFDEAYDEDDGGPIKGYDQFLELVSKLKNTPDDRRLVVSSWNPHHLNRMALPPCHLLWVCTHIDGILNLHWTQRSCDLFLGVPFNIASYGLLLELLCLETGLIPGNLSATLCDCHIYENHIPQMQQQKNRKIRQLPRLSINGMEDIFSWEHEMFHLYDYNPHSSIKGEVSI